MAGQNAPTVRRHGPGTARSDASQPGNGSLPLALALSGAFLLLWVALAIKPLDRSDWLLENLLTLGAAVALVILRRRFPLTNTSCVLIFLFLCLHTIGAHYTYAEVPYDAWSRQHLGFSLNELLGWKRNNFDRVVHFCYGLLLVFPVRELFLRLTVLRGFWSYFLPLDLTMSTSMLYELIEWAAAILIGGDLGMAYLGTQGDIWDAHKDMALASLGALITTTLTVTVNAGFRRRR